MEKHKPNPKPKPEKNRFKNKLFSTLAIGFLGISIGSLLSFGAIKAIDTVDWEATVISNFQETATAIALDPTLEAQLESKVPPELTDNIFNIKIGEIGDCTSTLIKKEELDIPFSNYSLVVTLSALETAVHCVNITQPTAFSKSSNPIVLTQNWDSFNQRGLVEGSGHLITWTHSWEEENNAYITHDNAIVYVMEYSRIYDNTKGYGENKFGGPCDLDSTTYMSLAFPPHAADLKKSLIRDQFGPLTNHLYWTDLGIFFGLKTNMIVGSGSSGSPVVETDQNKPNYGDICAVSSAGNDRLRYSYLAELPSTEDFQKTLDKYFELSKAFILNEIFAP